MLGAMMFKQTQTPFDVPGNWPGVCVCVGGGGGGGGGGVGCRNWPVMRVPQFIALR